MGYIHCFDGNKGGVGKSFVTMTFIQYCIDRKLPFIPVESDRCNPDVANHYKDYGVRYAIFSENQRLITTQADANPDHLIELAIDNHLIISLAAQVGLSLGDWLEAAIGFGQEVGVTVIRWYVTSGDPVSIRLVKSALKQYGTATPHVVVRNWYCRDNWQAFDGDPELQALLKATRSPVIDFPQLHENIAEIIKHNRLTFGAARESTQLHGAERFRVKAFLKKAYDAFESTGLVLPDERQNVSGELAHA